MSEHRRKSETHESQVAAEPSEPGAEQLNDMSAVLALPIGATDLLRDISIGEEKPLVYTTDEHGQRAYVPGGVLLYELSPDPENTVGGEGIMPAPTAMVRGYVDSQHRGHLFTQAEIDHEDGLQIPRVVRKRIAAVRERIVPTDPMVQKEPDAFLDSGALQDILAAQEPQRLEHELTQARRRQEMRAMDAAAQILERAAEIGRLREEFLSEQAAGRGQSLDEQVVVEEPIVRTNSESTETGPDYAWGLQVADSLRRAMQDGNMYRPGTRNAPRHHRDVGPAISQVDSIAPVAGNLQDKGVVR